MTMLAELARLIRSKNAGPFELTFDIMFEDEARYARVKRSGALTREAVAQRYGLLPEQVKFFYCDNAFAVKASIPRPYTQGDIYDADGHGGQQYAPLMDIEIPETQRRRPACRKAAASRSEVAKGAKLTKHMNIRMDQGLSGGFAAAKTGTDPGVNIEQFPADNHFGAEVKVTLHGGTVLAAKVDQPVGRTAEAALPQARLREKFENCANRALPAQVTAAVYAAIMDLDKLADVRTVNNAMTAEAAQQRTAATAKAQVVRWR